MYNLHKVVYFVQLKSADRCQPFGMVRSLVVCVCVLFALQSRKCQTKTLIINFRWVSLYTECRSWKYVHTCAWFGQKAGPTLIHSADTKCLFYMKYVSKLKSSKCLPKFMLAKKRKTRERSKTLPKVSSGGQTRTHRRRFVVLFVRIECLWHIPTIESFYRRAVVFKSTSQEIREYRFSVATHITRGEYERINNLQFLDDLRFMCDHRLYFPINLYFPFRLIYLIIVFYANIFR